MKLVFNIKKVQLSKLTEAEDGTITYGTPIKVPGTSSLSMDVEQSNEKIYADGGVYVTLQGASSISGTLENYFIPVEALTEIYNYVLGTKGEVIQTDDQVNRFGMQFACDDEAGNEVYFTYYDVTSTKPSINLQTREDGVTVNPQSVTLTASTIDVGGKKIVQHFVTKDKEAYANFFDKVVLPTINTI